MNATMTPIEVAEQNWATIQAICPKVTDGWDSPEEMDDDEIAYSRENVGDYKNACRDWCEGRLANEGETNGLRWARFDGVQARKGDRRIDSLYVIGMPGGGSVVLTQW